MLLKHCLPLHTSISIGVHIVWQFFELSIFSLPYSRLPPYYTVFFANHLVEKFQSTYTVTVTVIPSPYLGRHLTAVCRLRYGVQP